MDQEPIEQLEYQIKTTQIDGKEYYHYEYKKELNKEENQKLSAFLSKLENGLKNEDGMEGVIEVCKEWRKECDDKK